MRVLVLIAYRFHLFPARVARMNSSDILSHML